MRAWKNIEGFSAEISAPKIKHEKLHVIIKRLED